MRGVLGEHGAAVRSLSAALGPREVFTTSSRFLSYVHAIVNTSVT